MKKFFYGVSAAIASFSLVSVARAVTISTNIPGTTPNPNGTSPAAFVGNFYQYALMIGGVLAFVVIVYGGVRYMASAGNPSGQSDAKEWIESALLGLLLLIGAYFVLNVINPQLTTLALPPLQPLNIQASPTPPSTPPAASSSYSSTIVNQPTGCNPACVPPKTCHMYPIYGGGGMYSSGPTATYECQ
jgi:hypothetical protein